MSIFPVQTTSEESPFPPHDRRGRQSSARFGALIPILALLGAPVCRGELPSRPNIIIIMADDMGFSDLGCYGSEIHTPNLDRLAGNGMLFTQFYNTARCCPTRASLLTGLYPHQAGIGHMIADFGHPSYRGFLNDRCVTLAEVLAQAGYQTLMSGKWHVGENRPHWPLDRGFDRYFGLISGGSNYFRLDPGRKMAVNNEPYAPNSDGFYMTDSFSDRAVDLIAEAAPKEEPFFLYLAYTAPHWPLHAWEEDIQNYRGKYLCGWDEIRRRRLNSMKDLGIAESDWKLTPRDESAPPWDQLTEAEKDEFDLKMAVYAAQIESMDRGIGKVLDTIRFLQEEDNSLVLFLADNGGCAEEINRGAPDARAGDPDSFLSYGLPWANASNTPFRLYKHWVHEGGIATPLIAYWPDVIQKGEMSIEAGHVIDLMATAIEVAGAEYPVELEGHEIIPLEGKSLLPVFQTGSREGHEALFWEHEGNRAVRQGDWKLVSRWPDQWELYNLAEDRMELMDIAMRHPERTARMRNAYEDWARKCGVLDWGEATRIGRRSRR